MWVEPKQNTIGNKTMIKISVEVLAQCVRGHGFLFPWGLVAFLLTNQEMQRAELNEESGSREIICIIIICGLERGFPAIKSSRFVDF